MLGEVAGDNAGVLVDSPPLGAHRHVVPAGLSWTKQFLSGGTKNNRQRRSAFAFKGGKHVAFSRKKIWRIFLSLLFTFLTFVATKVNA